MKVDKVKANNKKRVFEVTISKKKYEFPYSRLELIPSSGNPIVTVFPDSEIGRDGFTYLLGSGDEDTVLIDQILEYNRDAEYMRRTHLYQLTIEAQKRLRASGIAKREIIRRMKVTPTQFYRLLDQTFTGKTIDQMFRLLAALDCTVQLKVRRAA